jgi:conjugal transfer pilus assembly protein TrbC
VLAIDCIFARPAHTVALLAALGAECFACGPAAAQNPAPAMPRLDNLPAPATTQAADIAAIASGYEAQARSRGFSAPPSHNVLIMVSFSMPPTSLVRLADQARRGGGVLVLNGLKDGSLTATARAVHQVFGKQGAPLQIDPRAFSRYAVSAVPTFVLLGPDSRPQSCSGDACAAAAFAKASGDVTLDYALEQIAGAHPAWQPAAQAILRGLRN